MDLLNVKKHGQIHEFWSDKQVYRENIYLSSTVLKFGDLLPG